MPDSIARWENEGGALADPPPAKDAGAGTDHVAPASIHAGVGDQRRDGGACETRGPARVT
jgi:hypothetical protein